MLNKQYKQVVASSVRKLERAKQYAINEEDCEAQKILDGIIKRLRIVERTGLNGKFKSQEG